MFEEQEARMKAAALSTAASNVNQAQQNIINQEGQPGIIKEQLDLGEELMTIDYLLKGYSLGTDDAGNMGWIAPTNEDLKIFSPYGINFMRQNLAWYLNKNTLLSNYDEEQIKVKMKNFADTLSMSVYLKYQKIFLYPSFERCKEEFDKELEDKKKRRAYSYEVLGKEVSTEEVSKEIVLEMEKKIDKEFDTIQRRLMKEKYSQFTMIMRQVTDTVHSAYQRAFRGMERTSLRKNIYVNESIGQPNNLGEQKKKGILGGMFHK